MNKSEAPIVLLTDFGPRDAFVGIMKGVIAGRAPKARVIDLGHGLEPQDIRGAALALRAAVPYFPAHCLFVVVVDPGVGSKRRVLWARSRRHQFLAPDNGVLSWFSGEHALLEYRSVENKTLFLKPMSSTFHGRDIFAPAAAALWAGLPPRRLGPAIADPLRTPFPSPRRVAKGLSGEILSFDRFGNAVTNIPAARVPAAGRLSHRGHDLGPLRAHYAAVRPGARLALAGSSGLVELCAREGDYRALSRARPGDPVHVQVRA